MLGNVKTYTVLTLLAISASFQAAHAGCLTDKQVRADQIKFVQASLTAAAMSCKGNRRDQILKVYNFFISRYRSDLMGSLLDLSLYYESETANGYSEALDRHIVDQTNYVLMAGGEIPEFCDELIMKTTNLTATPEIDSTDWLMVLPIRYEPLIEACQSQSLPQLVSNQ